MTEYGDDALQTPIPIYLSIYLSTYLTIYLTIYLEYGADPWKVTKYGDDALQTACIKGALLVFNHLIEKINQQSMVIIINLELCLFISLYQT